METKEIIVYEVNELSESSRKKAHQYWIDHYSWYGYEGDNAGTLGAFYEIFNPKECKSVELTGHRLAKYIINNHWDEIHNRKYYSKVVGSSYKHRHSNIQVTRDCPLTGYYIDDVILGPIYDFIDHPVDGPTLSDLVREGISKFNEEVYRDREEYYSMEGFLEECDRNEYRFLENGTRIDNLIGN
jgi:hypothetical protein